MMCNIHHVFHGTELFGFTFNMFFNHYHNWIAWKKKISDLAEYFVTGINSVMALEKFGLWFV